MRYLINFLLVFLISFVVYLKLSWPETSFNEPTLQAEAWIQGHNNINAPSYIEVVNTNGKQYSPHPPGAALIMLPFAWLYGSSAPQTKVCVFFGALCVAAAWSLFGVLGLGLSAQIWLTIFFGLGTCFTRTVLTGDTWSMPMVTAVFWLFLALIEVFSTHRARWVALWLACACLCRLDLVLTVPIFVYLLSVRNNCSLIKVIESILLPFMVAFGFYAWYNVSRYGSLFDVGIPILVHVNMPGQPMFSFRYFTVNLWTIIGAGLGQDSNFPYLHPASAGLSIPIMSPAFALAFAASWKRLETWLMWACVGLGSIAVLFIYWNGASQLGTRHFIEVFPFLLTLVAIGIPRQQVYGGAIEVYPKVDQLGKALICYSILMSSFLTISTRIWGLV